MAFTKQESFQPGQSRILILSWLTYTLAYTLRVNIAVVIPLLVTDRGFTFAQMGILTSLYFMTYMFGQLISGYLGDHLSSKLMIISGLFISALCNVGMAYMPSLTALYFCWAINGLAQSMLWAPLIKAQSVWFARYQLERVAFIMAQTTVAGYAVSWGLSSLLAANFGWQYAFLVPAAMVMAFIVLMIVLFHSHPADGKDHQPGNKKAPDLAIAAASADTSPAAGKDKKKEKTGSGSEHRQKPLSIWKYFRLIQLPGLLLLAICQGLIREGISVWFPTILQASGRISLQRSWLVLIVIPLINFAGILFVRHTNHRLQRDSLKTVLFIFGIMTGMAIILSVMNPFSFWFVILLLVFLLSLANGLTPILVSVIPFQYAQYRKVALTVGVLDFAIYLGAAISGAASGMIVDRYSWTGVIYLWLGSAVSGLLISVYRSARQKNKKRIEQHIHHSQ